MPTRQRPLYYYIISPPDDGVDVFVCVCVCVSFTFILDVKFVGCTSRGHTGGRSHRIIYPPSSFCDAYFFFLARRIQPFLSLVDRKVEFCVTIQPFSTCWAFLGKISVTGIRTLRPTCQKVTRLPTELPGRRSEG